MRVTSSDTKVGRLPYMVTLYKITFRTFKGGKQMNEIKTSCAPADSRNLTWDGMNWSKCETYVRKLQARIVKAQKEGRHNKVKTLQWMLTHSFTPRHWQ